MKNVNLSSLECYVIEVALSIESVCGKGCIMGYDEKKCFDMHNTGGYKCEVTRAIHSILKKIDVVE